MTARESVHEVSSAQDLAERLARGEDVPTAEVRELMGGDLPKKQGRTAPWVVVGICLILLGLAMVLWPASFIVHGYLQMLALVPAVVGGRMLDLVRRRARRRKWTQADTKLPHRTSAST